MKKQNLARTASLKIQRKFVKGRRANDETERILSSNSIALEEGDQNVSEITDNKLKSEYPKLFNSQHFRQYASFYTVFLEYLNDQIVEQNTETFRRRANLSYRRLFEKQFELKDFYSYKSHLTNNNLHLIFEHKLSSSEIHKMTQRILQDLRYRCPIIKYDKTSEKFYIDTYLLHNLYKDFLIYESTIVG